VANDEGWVSVGDTADTAEFAIEAIRRWWNSLGHQRFPNATRLHARLLQQRGQLGNPNGFFAGMYGGPIAFFRLLDQWRQGGDLEGWVVRS
jgi:hypothetical protein